MTFDVDMAWKYLHRGKSRYLGGQLKDGLKANFKGIKERWAVVSGKEKDAYFSFPELEALHNHFGLQPLFFFLLGRHDKYDRNMDSQHPAMRELVAEISRKYAVGIHPSYRSHNHTDILKEEITNLSTITEKPVTLSRQHFIKFRMPATYRNLLDQGIKEDYSMGYPESFGFRAGTSCPFFWYDLEKEMQTPLKVFPFAFMDATSRYYLHQNPKVMLQEWKKLFLKIKSIDGCFISIWHNFILSRDTEWLKQYEAALDFATGNSE